MTRAYHASTNFGGLIELLPDDTRDDFKKMITHLSLMEYDIIMNQIKSPSPVLIMAGMMSELAAANGVKLEKLLRCVKEGYESGIDIRDEHVGEDEEVVH